MSQCDRIMLVPHYRLSNFAQRTQNHWTVERTVWNRIVTRLFVKLDHELRPIDQLPEKLGEQGKMWRLSRPSNAELLKPNGAVVTIVSE